MIPQTTVEAGRYSAGALVTKVNPDAITVQGRIEHELPITDGVPIPGPVPLPIPATPVVVSPTVAPPQSTIFRLPTMQTEQIRRSAIVNGRLVTVSANAVKVTDLATVSPISFTSFRDR